MDQTDIPKLNLLQCIQTDRNDILHGEPQMCDSMWLDMSIIAKLINHLKPTGHVMNHQFNIQQLYALPTLYLCVLYLSENKQRLVPLTA